MSLISVKNLSLPFTKRWQLFSLMLVVLLFTLLRVTMSSNAVNGLGSLQYNSGALGGFSNPAINAPAARAYQAPVPEQTIVTQQQAVAASAPVAAAQAPVAAAPQASNDTSVFQDIFGGGQQPAKTDAAGEARKKSGLDDIEKSLGLR